MPDRDKSGDGTEISEQQHSSSKRRSPTTPGIASGCATASARVAPTRCRTTSYLELVLFRALPRRDTKGIAKRLHGPLRLLRRGRSTRPSRA